MAKSILILFVLAGILIAPEDLSSCGPFLPEAVFSGGRAPVDAARYYSGKLDIVDPHFARIYLMAAYRYLSGAGLSQADQDALLAPPPGIQIWSYQGSPAVQAWLRTRAVAGAPALDRVDQFKFYGQLAYIMNCGDDAFANAAATLGAHFQAGVSHEALRAWVAAQDQVFANCSSPQASIPAPVADSSWMRADRAYQIAAAEFYAGQFDQAASDFRRIAGDRSSPWHAIAPYLVARALIRKTTLVDAGTAPAAGEQLRQVLADPDAAAWHDSARGLLDYLRVHTDPGGVLDEAARIVEKQQTGIAAAMRTYGMLFDRFSARPQNLPRDEDLTDWIATMQYDNTGHGLEKWRATHSLPWLVAALTWSSQPDAGMMAAAARVRPESPAYLTVAFHRLRLMPADQARPALDAMLRRPMPTAARNPFLAERMRLARDWDELLRYAPRTAVGTLEAETFEEPAKGQPMRYFDEDAAGILDGQAPLAVLRHAAESPWLPANLQAEVARAVWVRAVLQGDARTARDIAPVLARLAPYLKPYLDRYLAAADAKAQGFEAAWLLLNNPGMRPSIDAGLGRLTPTPRLDKYGDNWWRLAAPRAPMPLNAPLDLLYRGSAPAAAFVKQAGPPQPPWPAGATYMARETLTWAEAHPDDPRVPESLYLAVRAGHLACGGDDQTDALVKRAFRLLHSRYPKSEAARRTPYWYKAGRRL